MSEETEVDSELITDEPKATNEEDSQMQIENDELKATNEEDSQMQDENDEQQITNEENIETEVENEPVADADNDDIKNEQNSETEVETEQKELEGPPPVEESDFRWCDNYSFVDDDKLLTDFNEDDPQKLILWAAQKNELETLRKLLERDPSLVNCRDNDLYTPLHRASYNNNVEVIGILLSYDADISAKTIDGWEPLHCACKWDSVEAVSLLIQNGADVNAQTNGRITPLHLAASNVYGRRTLELLLWHPYIDPNIKNDGGDTAYDIACRTGPWSALFEILEESVNVY